MEKRIALILSGAADRNIPFDDICFVLERLGFTRRIKGDHNIFVKPEVEEILNLQPLGSKAKAYQVRQVRSVLLKYKLGASK